MSIVVAAVLGAVGQSLYPSRDKALPPPLIAFEKMAQLVSLKVNVADVVEFSENRTLDIPWSSWELRYGGTKVLLIARGDCSISTNLGAATYESIDTVTRTVTVVLPSPTVLQARVNHRAPSEGGSRLYEVSNQGIEALIPGSANRTRAIDAAMNLAQRKIEEAGAHPDVLRLAKENAEVVLQGSFTALGWKAHFKWK